jgi:hypothetical protein
LLRFFSKWYDDCRAKRLRHDSCSSRKHRYRRPIGNPSASVLDSKNAADRRRINLRSEIIRLFRHAQIRLRALPIDRKTEDELVLRDQTNGHRSVQLDQFGRIQMVEVWFKLRAGGCICLERVTQPEAAQAALIHQLNWPLPQQPPPKIYQTDLKNVWTTCPPFCGRSRGKVPLRFAENAKVKLARMSSSL